MEKEEATVPTKSTPAQASQSAELEEKVETLSSECLCDSQLVKTKEECAEEAFPTGKELASLKNEELDSGLNLKSKGLDQPSEQASAQTSPAATQEGYDYTLVDKSLQNEDDMQCLICHLIPRVPAKVDCCGLIFCHACITAHSNKQKNAVCPHCNATDFKWMTDKKLERKINNLQVYCVNHNEGCEWTGDLYHAQEHLQKATSIGGSNVGRCDYEIIQCEMCGEDVMFGKLDKHIKDVCRHKRIPCEYEFAGCKFECPEIDMPRHIEENVAKHLSLVTKQLRRNIENVHVNTEQIRGNTEHIQDHDLRIQANTLKYQALFTHIPKILLICLTVFVFLFYVHHQLKEVEFGHSDKIQKIERCLNNINLSLDTVMDDTIELSKRVRSSEFSVQGLKYNLSRDINQLYAELVDISRNMTMVVEDTSENLVKLSRDVRSGELAIQTLQFDGRDMHSSIQDIKLDIRNLKIDNEFLKEEVRRINAGFTRKIDTAIRWIEDTFGRFIPLKLT